MWASSAADVGKIIVAARRYRGLTQTELADAIGATQSWVSEVEGKGYGSNRESTRNLELSRRSPKHLHHTVERAQIRKTSRTVYRCRAFLTHMFGLIDRATNVETSGMPLAINASIRRIVAEHWEYLQAPSTRKRVALASPTS
jgi:transcriptional regulator with XRE-family HTH domain